MVNPAASSAQVPGSGIGAPMSPYRSGVEGLAFDVLELVKEREGAGFDYAGELQGLAP